MQYMEMFRCKRCVSITRKRKQIRAHIKLKHGGNQEGYDVEYGENPGFIDPDGIKFRFNRPLSEIRHITPSREHIRQALRKNADQ